MFVRVEFGIEVVFNKYGRVLSRRSIEFYGVDRMGKLNC